MPRIATSIYAAHLDNVLKLAAKAGGISRGEIADALNVSRAVAGGLIKKADLELDHKQGRTEFFKSNGASAEPEVTEPKVETKPEPKVEPEVKAVAVADPKVVVAEEEDDFAALDSEIVDTRSALREAAVKAGKALGEWGTQQALVDAMRERLTTLAVKRMNIGS
jgi:hypothetical protein